jgi:hypothetical protein
MNNKELDEQDGSRRNGMLVAYFSGGVVYLQEEIDRFGQARRNPTDSRALGKGEINGTDQLLGTASLHIE